MTDINRLHNAHGSGHRGSGRTAIMQLPPMEHRSRPAGFEPRRRERMPASANLIRTVDGVELPVAGLWNIPSGWADIELSVPRIFRPAVRGKVVLKQGMIAVADDPTHTTAHLSLDAASLRTGDSVRDRHLHDAVFGADRNSTIPVRLSIVEHCGGPNWKAHGWITIRGVATPIELAIAYQGVHRPGSASFRATATVPLHSILGFDKGLLRRLLGGRNLRISIQVHAERARTVSRPHQRRTPR